MLSSVIRAYALSPLDSRLWKKNSSLTRTFEMCNSNVMLPVHNLASENNVSSYIFKIIHKLASVVWNDGSYDSWNLQLGILLTQNDFRGFNTQCGIITLPLHELLMIDSEDQLAFVIAHELGHYFLNHQFSNVEAKEREYQADEFGLEVMSKAGFSGYAAYAVFEKIMNCSLAGANKQDDENCTNRLEKVKRILGQNPEPKQVDGSYNIMKSELQQIQLEPALLYILRDSGQQHFNKI